jgi:hypothetical protein
MAQAIQVVNVQAVKMMRVQAILMQGIAMNVQAVEHLKRIAMMMSVTATV